MTEQEMRRLLAEEIRLGVRDAVEDLKKAPGAKFDINKRDLMRSLLREQLIKEFKPYFVEANVTKDEAVALITRIVTEEV